MLRRRQLLPKISSTKINKAVLAIHHNVLLENVKYFHSKANSNNNDSSLIMQPMKQPQQQQRKSSFLYEEKEDDEHSTISNDSLINSRQSISTNLVLQQQQHQSPSSIEGKHLQNASSQKGTDAFTSDDPATKYQHSASDDFFANVDKKRKLLKPTIQQLEFPSGMTERITAASSSRVGALYQLHYSDTNVREIIHLRGVGTFAVKLQGLSPEDYLDGKVYLDREAAGTVTASSTINTGDTIQKFDREIKGKNDEGKNNNSSSSSSSSPSDVGFLFTLYVENIPTDGALHAIAARFAVRRSDILTLGGYGKDQCTTQIAFAKMNTLSKEQILSINHMRFPGFCIKTSILYKKSNISSGKKEMFLMTRREFSINSSHHDASSAKNNANNNNTTNNSGNNQEADEDNDDDGDDLHPSTKHLDNIRLIRNEVTTLLRRVQVAGHEDALRAVLNEIRDRGAINYHAPIQQESLVFAFRRLQDAKFKSAMLQLLRHKNIHPALRAFVNDPSQSTAVAARRAIGNEQARGLLRTYIETNSFFRAVEAAPGSLKNLILRTSRRLAWNTMASRRIRREIVNHFTPGPVKVQLRVGDFIITNPELRCRSNIQQMKEQQQNEKEELQLKNKKEKSENDGVNQEEEEEEFSLGQDTNKLKGINNNNTVQDDFEKTILRQDVLFIEDEQHLQEILSSPEEFNDLDIVLPVPTHGALQELETHFEANKKHHEEFVSPVEFMRSCLEELRLLGLVETPSEHFSEEQWKTLLGIHKIRSNRLTFRPLMMDTRAIFVSGDNTNKNTLKNNENDDVTHSNSAKRGGSMTKLEVAIDPAPTITTIYDCNRVLLNDRLLLQGDRRNRGGLIDSYLSPQQYNKIIKTDEEEKKKQPQNTHQEQQLELQQQQLEDDEQSISYYEPSADEGRNFSFKNASNQNNKDTLVTNSNNKTAKQILDGLQLDSLITSKLLSHSTTALSFSLRRSDDMELRRKLKLPPPPVPTDKLQASWGISDQSGIFKSAVQEARMIQQRQQQQQNTNQQSSSSSSNDNDDGGKHNDEWASASAASPADFHSASPLSDTSRLSTVVTALVQLHIQPAMLPCLLRETLNLHGVVSEEDAKLQQKIHGTLRSIDTSDKNTWNSQFCPICFLTTHSQSSECPIHQRRMSQRLAQRERVAMAKESRHLNNSSQQTGDDNGGVAKRNSSSSFNNDNSNRGKTDEWEQAATETQVSSPSQKQNQSTANSNSSGNSISATVKISKDANSKGKWGVKVDKNLFIADGCVWLQPTLGPYEPLEQKKSQSNNSAATASVDDSTLYWKIVRVGASPVATFEQLKLALSMSGNDVELGLKQTRK